MKKIPIFLKDTFLVLIAEYFYYGVLFLIGILISRYFGDIEFGNYNLVFSVAQICILTLGSGFSIILRREIALNKDCGSILIRKIIILRLITILISLVTGIVFIIFTYKANFYLIISFIIIAIYRGLDLLNDTFFIYNQAHKNFKNYFIFKIAISICLLFFFYFSLVYFPKNYTYGYFTLAIISFLGFLVQLFVYTNRDLKSAKSTKTAITYKYILNESWPIIANSFFFQLNSRLSILLIGYLCTKVGYLGIYAASISIISAITMVGNGLAISLFSKLTETYYKNLKAFQNLLYKISFGMLLAGGLLTIVYYIFTPYFIKMYKLTDTIASEVFFWCGLSIPSLMMSTILGYIFTIMGKQKLAMLVSVLSLFISIIIIYFYTYAKNIIGASQAYCITAVLNLLIIGVTLKWSIIKTLKERIAYT
jgi:O-antigen/teichoic acid export membrane protein